MKILGNFDTKLDEKKFLEAKEKYGVGQVILIGKHWFFLIKSLFLLILAIIVFGILIYLTVQQYESNQTLLISFVGLYTILTGSWTFLTIYKFIGYIRNFKPAITDMNEENLESGKFESFVTNSLILFVGQVVIGAANLAFAFNETSTQLLPAIGQGILNIFFIWIVYKVLKDYIDYEMDFCLITPLEIEVVYQTGFLDRRSLTIGNNKIKSITDNKKGLLRSIFNFGNVVILTEGDNAQGQIDLIYVPSPSLIKDRIRDIMAGHKNVVKSGDNISYKYDIKKEHIKSPETEQKTEVKTDEIKEENKIKVDEVKEEVKINEVKEEVKTDEVKEENKIV